MVYVSYIGETEAVKALTLPCVEIAVHVVEVYDLDLECRRGLWCTVCTLYVHVALRVNTLPQVLRAFILWYMVIYNIDHGRRVQKNLTIALSNNKLGT